MQLDFEKAFDSIEWDFMFQVLKEVNLGDEFIWFVRCCYTCLLFILCVNIMGNRIRKKNRY